VRSPADFGFVRVGDLWVARGYVDVFEGRGWTSLGALMGCDGEVLDKPGLPGWRGRMRLVLSDGAGGSDGSDVSGGSGGRVELYLKRYERPPFRSQLGRVFSGGMVHGSAWVEWRWMLALANAGIPCAWPVAFGEMMVGCWERSSVVAIEGLSGASLETWAMDRESRCDRSMVLAMADFVRRFHGSGFVHRDLYLCHVFYEAGRDDGSHVFRLIDLQRVFRPVLFGERWRVKDLAALCYSAPDSVVTRSDRVRFLKRYLGVRTLGRRGKRLARRVVSRAGLMLRHDRKRAVRGATVGVE
jgi:Lipopolysaccharide kinase (Kdo/WaaP) family